jgi:hypothetical protein
MTSFTKLEAIFLRSTTLISWSITSQYNINISCMLYLLHQLGQGILDELTLTGQLSLRRNEWAEDRSVAAVASRELPPPAAGRACTALPSLDVTAQSHLGVARPSWLVRLWAARRLWLLCLLDPCSHGSRPRHPCWTQSRCRLLQNSGRAILTTAPPGCTISVVRATPTVWQINLAFI